LLFNKTIDVITQKMTKNDRKRRDSERRAKTKIGINQSTHARATSGLAWPFNNIANEVTVNQGTHINERESGSWTLGVHQVLKRNPSPDNAVMIKSWELDRSSVVV
jgi:hypothetical protein